MAKKVDWLIAGLGNPEKKYMNNRHNVGWMVAAALCNKNKKPIMPFSAKYLQSSVRLSGNLVFVALPTTYMNNSGKALKEICNMYDIPIDRVMIIVDEYNFPIGKIHLKAGGGDGGHNGVASVIEEMNSMDFLRLRCGIGKDFPPGGMVDYVLSDFNNEELEGLEAMINRAVEAIEHLVGAGASRAMSDINSGVLWKTDDEEKKKDEEPIIKIKPENKCGNDEIEA